MNALTTQTDDELIDVIGSSLYPGAAPESIRMVLGYCRAAGYDPMLKVAHIVPMSVKAGKNQYDDDQYVNRDVVMPGIGLYRTIAARTGQYAGMDEPEFGPMQTMHYKRLHVEWVEQQGQSKKKKVSTWIDAETSYPEWCKVTAYRIVGGVRCPFSAVEFWTENYATVSKNSDAPNVMWAKRPRGQLAKCAEAQALRKGFPEVGSQPTAEEMEGKSFMPDDANVSQEPPPALPEVAMPQSRSATTDVEDAMIVEREPAVDRERPTDRPKDDAAMKSDDGTLATVGERAFIAKKVDDEVRLAALCQQYGVTSLDAMTQAQFIQLRDHLRKS